MKEKLRKVFCCCDFARSASGAEDKGAFLKKRLQAKCLAFLLKCCTPQETVIPPAEWRRLYGKWAPIGSEGAEVLCELLLNQRNERGAGDGGRRMLTLDLQGLRIGDDGVQALVPFITCDDGLVTFTLSGNDITDKGVNILLKALQASPSSVRRLSLIDNPLTADGVLRVINFCATRSLTLTELSLSRGVGAEGTRHAFVHEQLTQKMKDEFIKLLHSSQGNTLVSFHYSGFRGKDFDAAAFGSILETALCQSKLQHLALSDCYTSFHCDHKKGDSSQSLAEPLCLASAGLCSSKTQLKSLELQIPLSEEAVTALAAGISGATFLSKLSLRGCSMSAESLRIIGNALAGNSTLISLDLSHQSHEVAHPLCGSHWRSRLSTGRTSSIGLLSRRPLLPVFEALHRNRTLQELIVLGIDIFNSDVEELCACVERSGNHVICHVRHTGLNSEPLAIKLESLLSQNRSKCRGDLFARTAVVKHSDPIQLPPSGKDKDARPKLQAQMENKIKECTEPMGNCQTPATPAVLGKVKRPGKGKNNEKNDGEQDRCVFARVVTTAVSVSSDSIDASPTLATPSPIFYSPCESCPLQCVASL
ncbi:hypothetical protein ECC02_007101 [Trypanosoma cruzi]|uniref:Uncharacterized protein n=1 Tax=Trypanosoma cruzi TaxID=5693 RepID=A0A7J6XZC1_TRYCR|nr:hypothetical protein ECC02_007101 [Trypanosoma cruzi]